MTATCNIRNLSPITVNWSTVEALMAEAGIPNDAALARLGGIPQSTLHRARRGAASPSTLRALKHVFPTASLDDLALIPENA